MLANIRHQYGLVNAPCSDFGAKRPEAGGLFGGGNLAHHEFDAARIFGVGIVGG